MSNKLDILVCKKRFHLRVNNEVKVRIVRYEDYRCDLVRWGDDRGVGISGILWGRLVEDSGRVRATGQIGIAWIESSYSVVITMILEINFEHIYKVSQKKKGE